MRQAVEHTRRITDLARPTIHPHCYLVKLDYFDWLGCCYLCVWAQAACDLPYHLACMNAIAASALTRALRCIFVAGM